MQHKRKLVSLNVLQRERWWNAQCDTVGSFEWWENAATPSSRWWRKLATRDFIAHNESPQLSPTTVRPSSLFRYGNDSNHQHKNSSTFNVFGERRAKCEAFNCKWFHVSLPIRVTSQHQPVIYSSQSSSRFELLFSYIGGCYSDIHCWMLETVNRAQVMEDRFTI